MDDAEKRMLIRLSKVLRHVSLELDGILERNGGAASLTRRKPKYTAPRAPKRKAPPAPQPEQEWPPRALDPFNPIYEPWR